MRHQDIDQTHGNSPSPKVLDITPGTTLGRYALERELGRGGMGVVYAAREQDTGRTVALKLLAEGADAATDRARFLREGRVAAAIDHPHVVYVYRTEEIDGRLAIAMELVPDGTLEQKIATRGPLPWEEAVRDILQIIEGLEAAASLGILHRDIKPSNVFVGAHDEMKVGDFGLSRPVDQVEQVRLTQTGMFLGTPVCSSPEQLLGETLDVRSDIYAVGATFYFLLTGRYPYEAANAVQLISQVLNGTPTQPRVVRPDLPEPISTVVMRCLARERTARFATYAELREALEATLPAPVEYARPLRRIIAAWIDLVVFGGIGVLPLSPMFGWSGDDVQTMRVSMVALALAWHLRGAIEGHFGFAAGKWFTGMRLQSTAHRPPGMVIGLKRAVASFGFLWIPVSQVIIGDAVQLDGMFPWYFVLSALLPFIRTSGTGGLAENDRFVGGRVVMHRPRRTGRLVEETRPPALLPGVPCAPRQIDHFTVTRMLHSPDGVLEAREADLGRSVWLVPATVDISFAGPVEPARASAPRRLSDVEVDGQRFRVYPAVPGELLAARLRRPCPWPAVRQWLIDLADELTVRGGSHAAVDVERGVIITPADRLVILPFRMEDRGAESPARDHAHPVSQLARAILQRDGTVGAAVGASERPAHASALLRALSHEAPSAEQLRERVLATQPIRGAVSRSTRGMAAAVLVGVTALNGLGVTSDEVEKHQQAVMVRFLGALSGDALSPRDRQAVMTFTASRLAMRGVTDSVGRERTERWQSARARLLDSMSRRLVDSLARSIPPSPADSASAHRMIIRELGGTPPGMVSTWALIAIEQIVDGAVDIWILCLLMAWAARRGVLLRRLHVEVIDQTGEPAGRLRLLLRQVVAGGPVLLLYTALSDPIAGLESTALPLLAGALVSWGVLAWSIWRDPACSVMERMSGTWLVRA